ncbi:MAG: hypothetical protein AABO57_25705 [Acidobacteriota bacterium]
MKRSLPGGTMTLFQAVTAHDINGVLISVATAPSITPDLGIEHLIFPDRNALPHVIFQQSDRVAPPLSGRVLKLLPERGVQEKASFHAK